MKPGFLWGFILGGFFVLTGEKVALVMSGDMRALPAALLDVTFSMLGLYQLFRPSRPVGGALRQGERS